MLAVVSAAASVAPLEAPHPVTDDASRIAAIETDKYLLLFLISFLL
jgi:hypothetical protein